MNEILKVVLSLSLSGSLLILLLFLLRPLFKERLSKRWQYYVWLVVVARLLLPFAPETNLMATLFQGIDRTIEQTEIVSPYTQQGGITDIPQKDDMENGQNNLHSGQTEPVESAINPVRNIITAVWKNLWLGWLVVALILFIRKITVYQDFVKYIRAGCVEVAEIDLLERFGKLIERNKVKTTVELYTNNLISSPLLIGFFRPSIVLPSSDLSPVDFEYTILHELTHFKRRDMFYKWLVQFSVCVHWFNPLVYLMSREVGRTCELSCDETVIRALDLQGRRAYGDTLLNAMGAGGNYKDSLASVTLNESKELLKERLDAIMKFKKPSKIVITVTVFLTMFLTLGATFTGIYSAAADNSHVVGNAIVPQDTANKPSLTLDIRSAAVDLQVATDGKISAEYNSSVYDVEINNESDDWKVNISCKTHTNTNTETINLYIPDVNYGDINIKVDSAYLTSSIIKSGNIIGNFNTASVLLTLPKGFSGSLDATVISGYFELISKDDFNNTNTTIIDDGEIGEVYTPNNFIKNGNIYTFINGTQNNVIKVTRRGTGVIGIYSSDYSDSVDIPSESQSEWENRWKDEWWKSWQNNWQYGQ